MTKLNHRGVVDGSKCQPTESGLFIERAGGGTLKSGDGFLYNSNRYYWPESRND